MSDQREETLQEFAIRKSEEIKKQSYLIDSICGSIKLVDKLVKDDLNISLYTAGTNLAEVSIPTRKIIRAMVLDDLEKRLVEEKYKLQCMLNK